MQWVYIEVFDFFSTFVQVTIYTMTLRLRQVLSVFLLVLFSLENIAAYTTSDPVKNISHHGISAAIEIQPLLALLTEESEEKDNKDDGDVETYISQEDLPFGSNSLPDVVGKAYQNTSALLGSISSALYKFFCSFLL